MINPCVTRAVFGGTGTSCIYHPRKSQDSEGKKKGRERARRRSRGKYHFAQRIGSADKKEKKRRKGSRQTNKDQTLTGEGGHQENNNKGGGGRIREELKKP